MKEKFKNTTQDEVTLLSHESAVRRTPILARIHKHRDLKTRSLTAMLAGLLTAFALKFFIKEAEIYTGGVTGFAQALAMLTNKITHNQTTYNAVYWGMYSVMNMPLIMFGYLRVGKRFTLVTLIVVASASAFGFTFDSIPGVKDFKFLHINDEHIARIYYTMLATLFYPIGISIAFLSGASAGGTDFIVTYYSMKKAKPIGGIMFYVSFATILLSVLIGEYIGTGVDKTNPHWDIHKLLSEGFILSIALSFIVTTVVDKLFPKQKKVEISVVTQHPDLILKHLKDKGYIHALTSERVIGTYSNKPKTRLTTVCTYMEKDWVCRLISDEDETCFITIKQIHGIVGAFRVQNLY